MAALQQLFDEMKAYAPPGILGWDNPDASNAFLNGDVAVLEGWASFILPSLDDPDASKIVGKWNVAPYPENGTGNFTQHNFCIFNTSQNQQAAFDYIAYCTGLETAPALLNEFNEESPRKTVWLEPRTLEEQPYLSAVVDAYDVGKPFHAGSAAVARALHRSRRRTLVGDVGAKLPAGCPERSGRQMVGADRAGPAGLGVQRVADDRLPVDSDTP